MPEHPPGTIIVPIVRSMVYAEFAISILGVDAPEDTQTWVVRSMDVTSTLNDAIRNLHGEWIWLQADDHHFPTDTLMRLLDRDVDVIVPLMNRKSPPFDLVIYKGEEMIVGPDGREYPAYTKYTMDEIPGEGIFPVYAAGSGSMLIRKHVLDAIGDPWFHNPLGTVINDDLEFCRKVREAGFSIHADADVSVGHLSNFTSYYIYERNAGKWGIQFDFGGPGSNRIWLTEEAVNSFDASRREDVT